MEGLQMDTRASEPADDSSVHPGPRDFSLVSGGPFFRLLCRARLADDDLMLLRRRIIVIALIAWLPLLVLSVLQGQVLGGNVAVPFALDVGVHARFLVAIPLLIGAELVVHQRMASLRQQFLERHLIPEGGMARFTAAFASAYRLRNSAIAEVLLLGLVYAAWVLIGLPYYMSLATATWFAAPSVGGGVKLSPAGMWDGYVSMPIFEFLLWRWYFRFFVWTRFLWQLSRIELRLMPMHPDRRGGLGFLSKMASAFIPLLIVHGAVVAAQFANRIFYLGAKLTDFKIATLFLVISLICLVLGPLLVFTPQLVRAKRAGLRKYGTLAQRYVLEFDAKWLRDGTGAKPLLLGSGDIQSLADLSNSFDIVRTMRVALFTKEIVILLAIVIVAPIAPLLLTLVSFDEILSKLLGKLF
jgi:hypothetical protein